MKITILCADEKSNYFKLNDNSLDIWTRERDVKNYTGSNPVITHAPCQQWSKMKYFATKNEEEKQLAFVCWEIVHKNGGIFEHPAHSSFFKEVNADKRKILSVNQFWWGFKTIKPTWLYFHNYKPLSFPLRFEPVQYCISGSKEYRKRRNLKISSGGRDNTNSRMTPSFCTWLIDCIKEKER